MSDDYTRYTVSGEGVTELCTLDGITYIAVAGELPAHSPLLTVSEVIVDEVIKEKIKAVSPHTQLIYDRMEAQIRERYAADDEMFLTRIGVGQALGVYQMTAGEQAELMAYQTFVENVRQWGREQRAELGL